MTELNRRSYDKSIESLVERVEALDSEVRQLRSDFVDHTVAEERKIDVLNATLLGIQVKLDQLIVDVKEPMEVYKSAKAGMSFAKFMAETAKWLVPLIVGLWVGFGSMDAKAITNKQSTETTYGYQEGNQE